MVLVVGYGSGDCSYPYEYPIGRARHLAICRDFSCNFEDITSTSDLGTILVKLQF